MTRLMTKAAVVAGMVMSVVMTPTSARAQVTAPVAMKPVVPLRVTVAIARYQGEKKVATVPFELIVNANELGRSLPPNFNGAEIEQYLRQTSVRVGVNVPAGNETTTSQAGVTTTKPTYRYVGTSIDCKAESIEDGRYRLYVSIDDSSIFTSESAPQARLTEPAAFRSLNTSNRVPVRDGQMAVLATVTDRLSGELIKIEVTANVIK